MMKCVKFFISTLRWMKAPPFPFQLNEHTGSHYQVRSWICLFQLIYGFQLVLLIFLATMINVHVFYTIDFTAIRLLAHNKPIHRRHRLSYSYDEYHCFLFFIFYKSIKRQVNLHRKLLFYYIYTSLHGQQKILRTTSTSFNFSFC